MSKKLLGRYQDLVPLQGKMPRKSNIKVLPMSTLLWSWNSVTASIEGDMCFWLRSSSPLVEKFDTPLVNLWDMSQLVSPTNRFLAVLRPGHEHIKDAPRPKLSLDIRHDPVTLTGAGKK